MAARLSVSRRGFLAALAIAGLAWPLAACQSNSDAMRLVQIAAQSLFGFGTSDSLPKSQVAAVPYATLGVRLGSSGEAMFVLGTRAGDNLQWVGGTQFAIATRDGRILRTTGFVHNLTGLQIEVSSGGQNASTTSRDFLYDLADLNAYGVIVHCSDRDLGPEKIEIIGDAHDTRHVVEDCVAPELDWNFSNEFWKDRGNGAVIRSTQYVHPGLDPITVETLRPAG